VVKFWLKYKKMVKASTSKALKWLEVQMEVTPLFKDCLEQSKNHPS
jgi:hypothetical protein